MATPPQLAAQEAAAPGGRLVRRRRGKGRPHVRQLQFLLDLGTLVLAFGLAYLLRYDFQVPKEELDSALVQLPVVLVVQLAAIFLFGISNFIWRYVGMAEIKVFALAAACSSLPVLFLRLGLPERFQEFRVPLSIIVMDSMLAFGGLLGIRVLRRLVYEADLARRTLGHRKRRVLVVGAGDAGVMIAKEIRAGQTDLDLIGLVDDNPGSLGGMVSGVSVLGSTGALPELCRQHQIDEVILAINEASRHEIRRIVDICERASTSMRIIPSYHEVVGGSVEVNHLREVRIEDLLGREPVEVDEARLRTMLGGKRVMVTGAGGSIGAEIARQVAQFSPQLLLLVERSEAALFQIHREMAAGSARGCIEPVLADVGDESRMRTTFANHRPEIVFHAAAHKHVPMVELNCAEAVRNNTLATRRLARLAGDYDVATFVLISTDKAIRPTSVMGATKRLAELVVQSLGRGYDTRYLAVRFGNVMNSAGSVIPIFNDQIKNGGPVTVTHPEMERYFMTIPEASRLVLQASALGEGGDVLFLDMGEPIRIVDLARDMIVLSGLKPGRDVHIEFIGTRPGEKLFEELEHPSETLAATPHPKILLAQSTSSPPEALDEALEHLAELASLGMDAEIRESLAALLPEARISARDAPGASSALSRRDSRPAQ